MKSLSQKTNNSTLIIPESTPNCQLSRLNSWQRAGKGMSNSNCWQLSLIAVGSASSMIYPHVPLVGFAAVAGNTLTRKKALISAMSIWFANQLYGFTIRQYAQTVESLTWGLVMGLGTLLITWLVTLRPKFSRYSFWGYLTWLVVSFVAGYAIYQGSIVLIAQLMSGHGFNSTILWGIFVKNVIWAAALSGIYCCVLLGFTIANKMSSKQLKNPS